MTFETFFRLISYAAVLCGFVALWVSGTFGVLITVGFLAVIVAAWFLEGSRWQISERVGTTLIVLALPAFYLAWRYQLITPSGGETWIAGVLARMILSLTVVKLLQRKSDRDWIFLYLMSFFQVLLAAGLSISALYLGAFVSYVLVVVCAVIAFEIRRTAFSVENSVVGEAEKKRDLRSEIKAVLPFRRLPFAAAALLVFIVCLAIPLFFMLPRVGGAGWGTQSGLRTSTGFSDTVRLGGIGQIQQSDAIAMRVKFDRTTDAGSNLYYRGMALDTFDNEVWTRSRHYPPTILVRGEGGVFRVGESSGRGDLSSQTIYLEPMDSPVIFAAPRVVELQGGFPILYRDQYGSFRFRQSFERVTYTTVSDLSAPAPAALRNDRTPYSEEMRNYLQLPQRFDRRIGDLAAEVTANARNRYDKAASVEAYLRDGYGYTLEQKAGGPEPLADFLFNVREGHCEYFASAMAMMLRTQGIATRMVTGFHGGEYNDAAGVTIVRQYNAHAWVEVYFPGENAWVRFDPTPAAGFLGGGQAPGLIGAVGKYLEALETFWIQNFVAYDDEEQRSLGRSVRSGFLAYQERVTELISQFGRSISTWLAQVRGEYGGAARLSAILYAAVYSLAAMLVVILLVVGLKRVAKLAIWSRYGSKSRHSRPAVDFYERMMAALAARGLVRQPSETPLEFAFSTGLPEAVRMTEIYHSVRFGMSVLSPTEKGEITELLSRISDKN